MDLRLKGKSVVISGGSKGLGKAIAIEFAKEGANVLIGSRNEADLQKAMKLIKAESFNDNVDYMVCDVTKPNSINEFVDKAIKRNGKVDVLINNTGGPPPGSFESLNDEDWYRSFELNLLSYIRLTREVIPSMKQQLYGRIVNIASSSIKQVIDNLVLSNTYRLGVVGLSKTLSQEYAKYNILVNTVGPGKIDTDRVSELDQKGALLTNKTYENFRKESESSIPIQRYGKPEEFAKTVVFLCSDANTYITGQSLLVDGGMVKAL